MNPVCFLVVAKAPHPGRVKTRLAADLAARTGLEAPEADRLAADLAAAALLDTLAACDAAAVRTGGTRLLALDGDLTGSARAEELLDAVVGWAVVAQADGALGDRLAAAHGEVPGPVVQVGMDTPQVTADLLVGVAGSLEGADAVLGPAGDGGWWVLAVRRGSTAAPLRQVTMSTPRVHADTRAALEATGLRVAAATLLDDVDHLDDVRRVAELAPGTHFARAAAALVEEARP